MRTDDKKIALISHSLGGGGAERAAGILSQLLSDDGYDVHNIIINDRVDYQFGGTLYNLGKAAENSFPFLRKFIKALKLRRYILDNKIACIIDNRARNNFIRDYIFKRIYGNARVIYIVHSANLKTYFPDSPSLAKSIYSRAFKIVCVSKVIEDKIKKKYQFGNTTVIYNPVNDIGRHETIKDPEKDYVLYFGRIEEKIKNFALMLEAFAKSEIYKIGFRLIIMGDGPDKGFIISESERLAIGDFVQILPFQKDPSAYVRNARFTILTSHYEGFPMSIVESLSAGTPVVAVNCESGPSEIIDNQYNGLLVRNHDSTALAEAIKIFAHDDELYQICRNNAAGSVAHLSGENIMKQWKQILPPQ